MSSRARLLSHGLAALLVAAGVVIAATIGGTVGQLIGFVLIALGLALATSLVFFEVGLSEDRERAREAEAREAEARERDASKPPREGSARIRLPRTRGHRRRIT